MLKTHLCDCLSKNKACKSLHFPFQSFNDLQIDYFMKPTISILFNIQLNCSQIAEYSANALMGVKSDHI